MSEQPKWTPGPWVASLPPTVAGDVYADRGGAIVAHLAIAEQRAANAHLIAAAPDLYAALEDALWALDNAAAILGAHGIESTLTDPRPDMRAALAKARGQA